MIKKLISSQSKTVTTAALILGAASFVSRIIGLVRERIFAHQFGAGVELDIYYAAFRIPDLIYTLLIMGALSAGFIPIFTKLWVKDKQKAWQMTNTLLSVGFLGLVVMCLVMFVLMPWLMPYIVPGFEGEQLQQTIILARIMLASPLLLGMSGIVSGVLQSLKSFLIYSFTPIFYNLGIIFGAIYLVPSFGLTGLAYGVIIGAFLHLIIQLPTLFHHGFRFKPRFHLRDPHMKELGALMVPRTLALATHQINLVVITVIASTLAAGSLTVFNFANHVQFLPIGIIGVSFALAAFPTLSESFAEANMELFLLHLRRTISKILFFILPAMILFLLLRAQIVRILFGTGEFGWDATIATANTLAFFSLSLFAQALIPLLARAFYAMHNTWMPLVIALVNVVVNVIAAWYFKDIFGVAGLALAFSLASVIQLALLWIGLRYYIRTLQATTLLTTLYKLSIAMLFMALSIQITKPLIASLVDMTRLWGILVQASVAGGVGLLFYLLFAKWLGVEEVGIIKEKVRKTFTSKNKINHNKNM